MKKLKIFQFQTPHKVMSDKHGEEDKKAKMHLKANDLVSFFLFLKFPILIFPEKIKKINENLKNQDFLKLQ